MLWKQKLWKYIQLAWALQEEAIEKSSNWQKKSMEATNLMTLTITAPIQTKLTDDKFNDGYKMYKRLKKLLQPSDKIQFMCLTWEYYTLNHCNYKDISEFLDYVKSLKEQINATEVKIIPDKKTLLCLTMAFWNKSHYQSLVQTWGVTKDIIADKAREMLLENERRF